MYFYLILFFTLFNLSLLEAAQVTAVTGTTVNFAIDIEDQFALQEKYYLVNQQNKRIGIVNITQIVEYQGTAQLLKGVAQIGNTLQRYVAVAAPPAPGSKKKAASTASDYLGVFTDFMSNSLDVKSGSTSLSMTGTSFGLSLAYQQSFTRSLKFRINLGHRSFNVKSESSLCLGGKCDLTVAYIAPGTRLDYYLTKSFFLGFGLEYLLPSSKSSTFLTDEQIQSNSTASLVLGFLIDSQFPITVSYNTFLENKNATASYLALQAGYMWPFRSF